MLTDCLTQTRRWIEVTPELIEQETDRLGQWLLESLSDISDVTEQHKDIDQHCLHMETISLTQEEFDTLEVQTLLGNIGSDKTH